MRLRNLRRRLAVAVLGPIALTSLALVAPPPASAASADEVRVLDLTNQVRASVGSQPLSLDESISATARTWAATVAAAGRISHNPVVGGVSSGSSALAENVVVGPSIDADQAALVASAGHYANMVNPIVSRVGIGVAWAGGMVYIVEDFLIVRGATAPTAPTATTSPPTTLRPPAAPPSTAARAPSVPTTPTPVPAGPSAWLTLSFEVLRDWERGSG
ncbi:MAG: CAP domain-containing protein [Actinomycetota bacterium]|nr:CAP domain-containing protein [Actinomycetota bacterium]